MAVRTLKSDRIDTSVVCQEGVLSSHCPHPRLNSGGLVASQKHTPHSREKTTHLHLPPDGVHFCLCDVLPAVYAHDRHVPEHVVVLIPARPWCKDSAEGGSGVGMGIGMWNTNVAHSPLPIAMAVWTRRVGRMRSLQGGGAQCWTVHMSSVTLRQANMSLHPPTHGHGWHGRRHHRSWPPGKRIQPATSVHKQTEVQMGQCVYVCACG